MGDNPIKILREFDFNGDKILDRVVARCDEGACKDHQVEIGAKGGQFRPLFDLEALRASPPPRPGDRVHYSPLYFLHKAQAADPAQRKALLRPIPFRVRLARSHPEPFSAKELLEQCDKKFAGDPTQLLQCSLQARQSPESHAFQAGRNEDPRFVYFESDGHPPLPPEYLAAGGGRLFQFDMNENPDLAAVTLRPVPPGVSLADQFLRIKTEKFLALARNDSSAQERRQAEAKKLIEAIEARESLSAEDLMGLLEVYFELKDRTKAFDKEIYDSLGKALEGKIRKLRIRSDLVGLLAERSQAPNWQWGMQEKLQLLLPYLDGMISSPRGAAEESWLEQQTFAKNILQLASQIPQLEVAALVGSTHRGVANDETRAIALRLSHGGAKRERMAFLYSIPLNFPGEKGLPHLLKLAKDREEEVRGGALQALGPHLASVQTPPEVKRAFFEALDDAVPKLRVSAALQLLNAGKEELAPALFQKIQGAKTKEEREVLERLVSTNPDDPNLKPVNLKLIALIAIAKFRKPAEAEAWLKKMLEEEKDGDTLVLVASALGSLLGPRALGLVFQRLQKAAPDPLFLQAIQWVDQNRIRQAAPYIYRLIQHPSAPVRGAALSAVRRMDERSVLFALLKDSHHQDPQLRLRSVQALSLYHNRGAPKRLIALLKDPDEKVREAALEGLQGLLKVEPPGTYVRKLARDDKFLREKLGKLLDH